MSQPINQHSKILKTSDHIYYDIVISNTQSLTGIVAAYSETRGEPILDKPSDYYLAIDRFSIPGLQIPIFVFQNNTYSVAMDYNGTDSGQVYLIFDPTNDYPITDFRYYYIYNYQQFITMINTALATAFTNLPSKPTGATAPPYLTFDPINGLISFIAQQTFTPDTADPLSSSNLRVYMNTILYNFFSNFYNFYWGINTTYGKNLQLLITNTYNNGYIIPYGAPGYNGAAVLPNAYISTQEFNTLYNWNDFNNIVITSGSLPVAQELIPTFNSDGTQIQNTKNSRTILSDFFPLISQGPDARSVFQYSASGKYRYIDLLSDSALNTFDIQIYWEGTNLTLTPLYLAAGATINIKFAFIRKNKIGLLTTN